MITQIYSAIDSIQEIYDNQVPDYLIQNLKKNAGDIFLGLKIENYNSRGFKLMMTNEKYLINIGDNFNGQYQIMVRFLSFGLHKYGFLELRKEVLNILEVMGETRGLPRINRVDFCQDFQSSDFENEFQKDLRNLITRHNSQKWQSTAGSETETETGRGKDRQTYTIGSHNNYQICIYNKTLEIKKTAKEWFKDIWKKNENYDETKTVFRIEIRLFGDFLKPRHMNNLYNLMEKAGNTIEKIMTKNRLLKYRDWTKKSDRLPTSENWLELKKNFLNFKFQNYKIGDNNIKYYIEDYLSSIKKQAIGCLKKMCLVENSSNFLINSYPTNEIFLEWLGEFLHQNKFNDFSKNEKEKIKIKFKEKYDIELRF